MLDELRAIIDGAVGHLKVNEAPAGYQIALFEMGSGSVAITSIGDFTFRQVGHDWSAYVRHVVRVGVLTVLRCSRGGKSGNWWRRCQLSWADFTEGGHAAVADLMVSRKGARLLSDPVYMGADEDIEDEELIELLTGIGSGNRPSMELPWDEFEERKDLIRWN